MKPSLKLPKVRSRQNKKEDTSFPLEYYSNSSFVKFCTNPILFKINYINGDRFETSMGASAILGHAFHKAMEAYYGGLVPVANEQEGIKEGLEIGMEFIKLYNENWINWTTTIPNKQKLYDKFTFAFNSYVAEMPYQKENLVSTEELLEEYVDIEHKGERISLPIKLKGYTDRIIREDGKLKIVDYKVTYAFSNPDKIDGSKIIQAITYYFLTYAKYEEEPYSMIFEEIKHSKNSKGGKQVQQYEIVFADNPQFFDFYLRLYNDITNGIRGKMVYVPNIQAMFDNEIAMVAYIHRLDMVEELAEQMKEQKVKSITEVLKKKLQNASNMDKLLKTVEKKFISAKNLNYSTMKNEEKIKVKLMEYGMMLDFDSKIEGNTVDLYQYTPAIGIKMSRVASYVADIEQVLGVSGVRVLAPIPDTTMVGFEVPRKERKFIEDIPDTTDMNIALGQDVYGKDYIFDIREAPHLLVAGASGSGKSVFLNAAIKQFAQKDNVELYLFDPKRVELIQFKAQATVYQSEDESIALEIMELVKEMERRYEFMESKGLRKMNGEMPYKIIVIDEFGDLTLGSEYSKLILQNITLLAQKARAAGMHIIIATQRPSVDVITGTIKNNFPTKIAFRMSKAIDSQVVGIDGAEKLTGKGDCIFSSQDGDIRLQAYNA